jgi:hypothetical protein
METTYAFVFNGSDWRKATQDDWDISVIEISGKEKVLGHRQIDGVTCKVIQLSDGQIIALSR